MRVSQEVHGAEQSEQDRAAVIRCGEAGLLVVADGAGGIAGGTEAAELVVRRVREMAPDVVSQLQRQQWSQMLAEIDEYLVGDRLAGETTAVLVWVEEGRVQGGSVGDSGAWLISPDEITDLTQHQRRKPLLGTGEAIPVAFGPLAFRGRLVVASDGLFKYAKREEIQERALAGSVAEAAAGLVDAVRLPSGALQDDVAVIVCEMAAGVTGRRKTK